MKETNELISIIVLAYNTEKYIKKCLDSIMKQTYKDLEIIVINDGSEDNTSKIVKKMMKKDNRICFIEHENKGTYLCRLEGYKKANGKYIMYVDSDDYILNDAVKIMYDNLKEYKVDVVHCQYKIINNGQIEIPKNILNRNVVMEMEHLEPQFFDLLYKTTHCDSICRQLIKKRGIMKNVGKIAADLTYKEDLACNLKIYKEMKSFLFIPDELYIFNQNKDGVTHSKDNEVMKKRVFDTIYVYYELFKSVKDFNIKDKKYYKKMASIKMYYYLVIMLSNLIIYSGLKKKEIVDFIDIIINDKKVKEVKKFVEKYDLNEIKKSNTIINKNMNLLLDNKIDKFYFNTRYKYKILLKKQI